MDINNHQKNNKKLSKVLSTKLSIEDYNSFQMLTKLEYESGLIKEQSTSELLRFTIRHILKQAHNQSEYLILKQQQQKAQNNQQQQFHNQHSLQTSTTTGTHQQHQVPNTSQRKNLVSQKNIIPSPSLLSSLLSSTQTNQLNYDDNSSVW
jgi:hypothetical protein